MRLAQGNIQAAEAAIRRVEGEASEPVKRARVLPAYIEIVLAVDDVTAARLACEELASFAKGHEDGTLEAIAAQARGAVELAAGEPRAALVSLRRAGEVWRQLEAPYETACVRELLGRACRELGDEDGARLELEAARHAFDRLGAATDLARVDLLVELSTKFDRHGLSDRELEVLRLIAAGNSNREIAAALVISEHTAARHVQNIFAKLGVSSRTAAGAFAFEHHLV
jgi:ATP/maltotriose-dependent transcriptional regulator MalT